MDKLLTYLMQAAEGNKRRIKNLFSNPSDETNALLNRGVENTKAHLNKLTGKPYSQVNDDAYKQAMEDVAFEAIVKPEVANKLIFEKNMPTDENFSQSVANTMGASITDEGLLMRVQRNQLPEQGMQPSVRGGVFYLPEGAQQAKYYSTGKNGYGGSEKIVGETLIKNPLFSKGGTGGKAPETAYDSLLGKGAYQAMRNDALKVRLNPQLKGSISPDEFLAKYAPDLDGMGEYIYMNSRQGNQLAYALQEAAVGSAVRNAGHDAVLGYSKGKSGPFLSEVFDVRESLYPDKFGGYGLHENLYKHLSSDNNEQLINALRKK